jgi:hypothetical protein
MAQKVAFLNLKWRCKRCVCLSHLRGRRLAYPCRAPSPACLPPTLRKERERNQPAAAVSLGFVLSVCLEPVSTKRSSCSTRKRRDRDWDCMLSRAPAVSEAHSLGSTPTMITCGASRLTCENPMVIIISFLSFRYVCPEPVLIK